MKRFICWLIGHASYKARNGDFLSPYCPRCDEDLSIIQILKDALGK